MKVFHEMWLLLDFTKMDTGCTLEEKTVLQEFGILGIKFLRIIEKKNIVWWVLICVILGQEICNVPEYFKSLPL